MKIVCAYCGKDMGEKDGEGIEGSSHGVCEQCFKKLKAKKRRKISREDEQGEHKTH